MGIRIEKPAGNWPRRLIEGGNKMADHLVFLLLMIVIVTTKVKIVVKVMVKKQ
jgi:hypothetical protein